MRVWSLFLISVPVVGLSIWLGSIVKRYIERELFAKLVFGTLLIIGLIFLSKALK